MIIGFNIGAKNARAAVLDNNKKIKLISCRPFNNDLTPVREDAEIFIDDFCTSCVISFNYNNKNYRREDITRLARDAGISEIKIISEYEAMAAYFDFYFNNLKKFLVVEVGAGAAQLSMIEKIEDSGNKNNKKEFNKNKKENNYKILESAAVESVGGDKFDIAIAEWLKNLRPDIKDDKFLLNEAEKIKIKLAELEEIKWENINIYREDIERLIKFQIRELAHTARRMTLMHKPEKIFFTGGTCKIPLLNEIFNEIFNDVLKNNLKNILKLSAKDFLFFCNDDIATLGTALYAKDLKDLKDLKNYKNAANSAGQKNINNINKLRELKLSLIEIEYAFTRNQKDRLHVIFQRVENDAHNPDLIKLCNGLVNELYKAAANI